MQLHSRSLRRESAPQCFVCVWVQSGEVNSKPSRMTQVLEERYVLCVVGRIVRVTCRVLYGKCSKRCRRAHSIQCVSAPFPVTVTSRAAVPAIHCGCCHAFTSPAVRRCDTLTCCTAPPLVRAAFMRSCVRRSLLSALLRVHSRSDFCLFLSW